MNDLVARKQALPLGFDYNAYIKYNPDIAYSWDHDLATHWILYGQAEGRQYKEDSSTIPGTDISPYPSPNPVDSAPTDISPVTTPQPTNNNGLLVLGAAAALIFLSKRKRKTRTR